MRHLPNALTCCNLLCGCLAILQALQGQLFHAGYFVAAALVFDFFDGFMARQLGVASAIGKDLDSLADLVTFGVAPGMVMYSLISISAWVGSDEAAGTSEMQLPTVFLPAYFALMIPLFSALRLAKFNNDIRQSDTFFGLPTPANAMVICSLPFIAGLDKHGAGSDPSWLLNTVLLCAITAFMSLLLVSGIELFALKFSNFSWKDNRVRYIFLIAAVAVLALCGFTGIPLVVLLYVLTSLVNNILLKKKV
jgi:CDP-diacylglycerol---serine O-phosphatidyltransferase